MPTPSTAAGSTGGPSGGATAAGPPRRTPPRARRSTCWTATPRHWPSDPDRLTALVSDAGWVDAAIQSVGVDRVLADLRSAAAADPADAAVASDARDRLGPGPPLETLHRRSPSLATSCGSSACRRPSSERTVSPSDLRARLRGPARPWPAFRSGPRAGPAVPCPASSAATTAGCTAVAVLPDGRVVSGGDDRRVLVWDPAAPGTDPVELGRHDSWVVAVAVLPDGRVVSGGDDGGCWCGIRPRPGATRSSWPPRRLGVGGGGAAGRAGGQRRVRRAGAGVGSAAPGSDPVELGRHDDRVPAVAVLPDGRVVSGGTTGGCWCGIPPRPGSDPVELGRHDGWVWAVAVLPDGRVVSGGDDGRVLVWDPAAPGSDPVELGRHDGCGDGGGGAAGRAGGQRRGRRAGAAVGSGRARGRPGRARPPRRLRCVAVAVLPDGRVVSGGDDGRVLVWDPAAPAPVRSSSAATTAR